MFKIAVLDNYTKKKADIKQLCDRQIEFSFFDKRSILEQLSISDGVIMFYKNDVEKTKIYEQIVTIRNISQIPIWVMAEEMSSSERLIFLKLGVLVIVKEFAFDEELSLSLSNALNLLSNQKAANKRLKAEKTKKITKNMTIDEQNFSFCLDDGRTIYLTRLEYRLFVELAKEPNQTVLYADLIERIWSETVQKDTIYRLANLVFHVRQKLRKEQINPEIIKTIRSRGYMLYE